MKGAGPDRDLETLGLREGRGALLLPLRVRPRAGREGLLGLRAGRLLVAIHEAPERGRANEAVLRLLAEAFAVPRSALALVAGATSRDKIVRIAGLSLEEGRRRLRGILDATG